MSTGLKDLEFKLLHDLSKLQVQQQSCSHIMTRAYVRRRPPVSGETLL